MADLKPDLTCVTRDTSNSKDYINDFGLPESILPAPEAPSSHLFRQPLQATSAFQYLCVSVSVLYT